ncbi:MAG: cysteinyl-tRNA synthetase [Candidatus Paceibacteria bacterium]|jgi:cysteinyl-tRNA synthetase
MEIYLKNTKTKEKELFKPIKNSSLSMYTCGPTVYDKTHIGHLKAYVFADTLKRVFEYNKYNVRQIMNITDVGHLTDDGDTGKDKVEEKAKKENISAKKLTESLTQSFKDDLDNININILNIEFPKATDHIDEQIQMIKDLEEKDFTYQTSDGVYFDTSKFPSYGSLGGIDIEGLQEGARVEVNTEKRNPTDFALWKLSKEDRQQEWKSPWGVGFPGWHLECSAMARKYLGDTFDIHTGGIDHIGTHHNNEIAQTESLTGKTMANYWMHSSHVLLDNKKISKSLGNTYSLDDLKEKGFSPLAYRYWLLTADYKTLTNFTFEALDGAKNALDRLMNILQEKESGDIDEIKKKEFMEIINDDLDTPKAIAYIWSNIKDLNKETILDFDKVLGLKLKAQRGGESLPDEIQEMVDERLKARDSKDFLRSDNLREMIEEAGYEVKDTDKRQEVRKK